MHVQIQLPQCQELLVGAGSGKHHGHMHGTQKKLKEQKIASQNKKQNDKKRSRSRQRQKKGRRHLYGTQQDIERRIRQMTPERKALKEARRTQKNKQLQKIFSEIKSKNSYFDQAVNAYQMQKYYLNMKNISYEQLNKLLSETFQHARRRQNLFPIVDRHPDYTLRCVYTGAILSDSQGNMLMRCDQQHSFPQSFQRGKKSGTGRDMHAIFAASKSANGSRGNMPFGKHSNEDQIVQENQYGKIYSSKGNRRTYIPKLNSGAIARSTLYILTAYKGCANLTYFSKELLPWLIQKAAEEPISEWQKHRNSQLFKLQGNRNPFVDYPQWSKRIDFSEGWQQQ